MAEANIDSSGQTVGWVADPNGRGTFTLFTSCLLTLVLCVWSAIQLDVPPPKTSRVRLWLLYLKWSILGVLGPELFVYVAWRQLNSARTLKREVREALQQRHKQGATGIKPLKDEEKGQDWSLTHGFYGGMGGFVFDFRTVGSSDLKSCLPNLQRLTLTARGVALLARCGLLPELDREEIDDKNKADHLAKTVVCVQATWFLVQTIARTAQHLSVSLLEVMTIAHVVCALFVYILWWNKPAMVREPTYLLGKWVPPLCAYMYMSSQISVWEHDRPGVSRRAWLDSELSALAYITDGPLTLQSLDGRLKDCSHPENPNTKGNEDADNAQMASSCGYLQPCASVSESLTLKPKTSAFSRSLEKVLNPSTNDHKRWQLCVKALQEYPEVARRLVQQEVEPMDKNATGQQVYTFFTEELVTESSSNWPSEHLLRGTRGLIMGIILWSATVGFGAIHLAAWGEHFPSVAEAWLWRASALYIAGSGALWMLINILAKMIPWVDRFWDSVVAMKVNRLVGTGLVLVCACCGFLYASARFFLVLEAFISLRALPPSTYKTPDWTQLVPHF